MSKQYILLPYTVIKISGPDAEKFLQGQLSCDVSALQDGDFSYGTANTAKGRVYALFTLTRIHESYYMRINRDIADYAVQTLSKYKVFFKCDMAIQGDLKVYGERVSTEATQVKVDDANSVFVRAYDDANGRREIWTTSEISTTFGALEETEHWFADDCLLGIPEIYPQTQDEFVLQQINLQALGAVSFNKGCYTGQEIIARMKFLGKLKKKTFLFEADNEVNARPGDAVFSSEGKKLGQIVRSHSLKNKAVGLVMSDMAAFADNPVIYLGTEQQTPLSLTELHYKTD